MGEFAVESKRDDLLLTIGKLGEQRAQMVRLLMIDDVIGDVPGEGGG